MSQILYLIPLISAAIGWLTNYLAVKMLFHPREPVNFILFSFQGVFPKRQKELAQKLGNLVAEELFSVREVSEKIEQLATGKDSIDQIGKRIENTIRNKLVQSFPMLAMFLTDEMIEKVTSLFKNELEDFLIKSAKDLGQKLEQEIKVDELVREKVESFSSDKLESILFSIMKKEFKFIELIGALIGFTIGCVQVGLTLIS